MQFDIRQATTNDAESICQLLMDGGELHSQALPTLLRPPGFSTTLEFVKGFLADSNAQVLLAELNDRIIGFVHFNRTEQTEHPAKVARSFISVSSLMVQEEYRHQGIGSALMREVHNWAEKQAIHDIELHVYEFNRPALNFYEKLGYHTTSRRMMKITR
jgi:ribosomal protein S18 acetylase RimI-like enzyme